MTNWSLVPDGRLTPRRTGQLIVGRNLTSTLRVRVEQVADEGIAVHLYGMSASVVICTCKLN
jgi:hypothetical protein